MATLFEQDQEWKEWVAGLPPVARALAERFPTNKLFWLSKPGQRVVPVSYNDNGTLTVSVQGKYNLVDFEREVFGIAPEDLVECELPGEDEPLGVMETLEETLGKINMLRALRGLPPLTEEEMYDD